MHMSGPDMPVMNDVVEGIPESHENELAMDPRIQNIVDAIMELLANEANMLDLEGGTQDPKEAKIRYLGVEQGGFTKSIAA